MSHLYRYDHSTRTFKYTMVTLGMVFALLGLATYLFYVNFWDEVRDGEVAWPPINLRDGFGASSTPVVAAPTLPSGVEPIASYETVYEWQRPKPAATPEPTAVPTPVVPREVRGHVANTGGDGVNLRREASLNAPSIRALPEGAAVTLLGDKVAGDSYTWVKVRDRYGNEGWMAEKFVVAVPSSPTTDRASDAAESQQTTTSAQEGVARVGNTGGEGVYVRATPNMADRIVAWPDRTHMQLVGEETESNGIRWVKVRDPAGNVGWIPAQYLIR